MKQIFLLAAAVLIFSSCQQNKPKSEATDALTAAAASVDSASAPVSPDAAVMTFETSSHDFGKIKHGEKVHYDFRFKNTGKSPLIVSGATATCGCTVPEPPKEPVQPGESGVIKVIFDSTGKNGLQDKVITVTSNANPSVMEVHLTGEVSKS